MRAAARADGMDGMGRNSNRLMAVAHERGIAVRLGYHQEAWRIS